MKFKRVLKNLQNIPQRSKCDLYFVQSANVQEKEFKILTYKSFNVRSVYIETFFTNLSKHRGAVRVEVAWREGSTRANLAQLSVQKLFHSCNIKSTVIVNFIVSLETITLLQRFILDLYFLLAVRRNCTIID